MQAVAGAEPIVPGSWERPSHSRGSPCCCARARRPGPRWSSPGWRSSWSVPGSWRCPGSPARRRRRRPPRAGAGRGGAGRDRALGDGRRTVALAAPRRPAAAAARAPGGADRDRGVGGRAERQPRRRQRAPSSAPRSRARSTEGDLDYFAVDAPIERRGEIVATLVLPRGDASLTIFDDAGRGARQRRDPDGPRRRTRSPSGARSTGRATTCW